jgi:hypothetical protein
MEGDPEERRNYFPQPEEEKEPPFTLALGPFSPWPNETMMEGIARILSTKE